MQHLIGHCILEMLFQQLNTLISNRVGLFDVRNKLLEFAILNTEIVIDRNKFLVHIHMLIGAQVIDLDINEVDLIFECLDHNFIGFQSLFYPLVFFLVFY